MLIYRYDLLENKNIFLGGDTSWLGYSEQEIKDMGDQVLNIIHNDDRDRCIKHHDHCRLLSLGQQKEIWFRLWPKLKKDRMFEPIFTRSIDKCIQLDDQGLCRIIEGQQEPVHVAEYDGRKYIEKAFKENLFEVWYQPIVDLETNGIVGYEALSRIRIQGQILKPYRFLPYLIGSDLEIDWVTDQLKTIHEFLSIHKEFISLNLSNFILDSFSIQDVINSIQSDRDRLLFEVNEEAFGTDLQLSNLHFIKRLGHRLEADDVPQKSTIPLLMSDNQIFDAIKIDRSVCNGCSQNTVQSGVAKMLIDLAKKQNLLVVCEGIENNARGVRDAELLKRLGAQYGQGFLWGEPKPLT